MPGDDDIVDNLADVPPDRHRRRDGIARAQV